MYILKSVVPSKLNLKSGLYLYIHLLLDGLLYVAIDSGLWFKALYGHYGHFIHTACILITIYIVSLTFDKQSCSYITCSNKGRGSMYCMYAI